ncbi:MAG: TlpA family protein disulfide reductase [Anaerolineales bacterium]|nr:TlpA family protein disulfide reductase [Anaerolineales bacterium]
MLLAVIILMAAAWMSLSRLEPAAGQEISSYPYTGFRAPDFTLNTLDGEMLSLVDFQGQVVILNFWATWCTPCRLEMPALEQVQQELGGKGVVVLGVNTTYQDSSSAAAAFVAEYNLSFPVVLDTENHAASAYNVRATPTTFIIDSDGVIRHVQIGGPLDEVFLFSEVEALLGEVD